MLLTCKLGLIFLVDGDLGIIIHEFFDTANASAAEASKFKNISIVDINGLSSACINNLGFLELSLFHVVGWRNKQIKIKALHNFKFL
jgi:hypothetical protein